MDTEHKENAMSEQQSTEATEPKSLAGTTDEMRAPLLKFGSGKNCTAFRGDNWFVPVCDQPAPWYVGVEDSHAGMTSAGYFSPAETYTYLCDSHLAEVRTEPRLVLFVERRTASALPGNVSVINVSALDGLLGGAE